METINFTKMHGIGNDYVYINCMERCPDNLASLSREMSDRHCGIGGDGIILIMPSKVADFKMRIFNADGSEARMCGNGARCVAKYVYDNNLTHNHHVTLETLSGVKHLFLKPGQDDKVESVTVDMGTPVMECSLIPVKHSADDFIEQPVLLKDGTTVKLTAVSMGNPHAVTFTDNLDFDIETIGPELEAHPLFPDRANIEFARVVSPSLIEMRVWERGSGETMACGTGACATAVAAITAGLCNRRVTVKLLGGCLDIEWSPETGHVMMTGPATTVFTGQYTRQSNTIL